MNTDENGVCPHCGALMVEYRFGLNKGLLGFLKALARVGIPSHLDALGLTKGQYTNHALTRHWGLAGMIKPETEEEERKGGKWALTSLGLAFLRGEAGVPKYVVTYRNKIVRHEGERIFVGDVEDGYLYRGDYRAMAAEQIFASFGQDGQGVLL